MKTDLSTEMRDGVEVVVLRSDDAMAEVVPAYGNNCWLFRVAGEDVLEKLAWATFRAKPTSYGIPILFPFPNRIRDQKFTWRGRDVAVDVPQHGWLRARPWKQVDAGSDDSASWVTARFDAADWPGEILNQWPWPFAVEVTWRLSGATLEMLTHVENTGDETMPYGFGIHPYFHKPLNATVTVPALRRWRLASNFPTGETEPVQGVYDLRDNADVSQLSLDDIYTELRAEEGTVNCTLVDRDAGATTTIAFTRDEFPDVVVYTPPKRDAICVEPNTCPTDAFNLEARGIGANVRVLEPGASERFTIRIERTSGGPTAGS